MHTHHYPGVMFSAGSDTSRYDIMYYRYDYDTARNLFFAKIVSTVAVPTRDIL